MDAIQKTISDNLKLIDLNRRAIEQLEGGAHVFHNHVDITPKVIAHLRNASVELHAANEILGKHA